MLTMEREYKCVGIDRYHRGRKCGYGLVPWCPALTAYAKRPAALLPIYGLWEIDFPLTAKLEMELEGDVLNIYRPKN